MRPEVEALLLRLWGCTEDGWIGRTPCMRMYVCMYVCMYFFNDMAFCVAFGFTFPATSACAPFSRLRCRWMAASSCGDVIGIMGVASGKKREATNKNKIHHNEPQQPLTDPSYTHRQIKEKPCR